VPWRGARFDEALDALAASGRCSIPASHVDLRSVQRPRPLVHLGGPGGMYPGRLSVDVDAAALLDRPAGE
jgi:hypothetical protein